MRLFVGLQLPSTVLSVATNVQKCVLDNASDECMRPVPLSTHGHITLVFLGECKDSIPSALRTAVRSAVDSLKLIAPPQLRVQRKAATFGNDAAVVYVPISADESTYALQKAIRVAAISVHPETARDRRKYRAHITLARSKGGKSMSVHRYKAIRAANRLLKADESDEVFSAHELVLFESSRNNDNNHGKLIYKELWKEPVCPTNYHD